MRAQSFAQPGANEVDDVSCECDRLVTLATTLAYLHLPRPTRQLRFDVSGTLLLGGAVSCLVLLASRIGTSVDGHAIAGLTAAAVLLLVGWLLVERRAAEPVLPDSVPGQGFPRRLAAGRP